MGAADIATTSNHSLDQGRPAENPNIRVPLLPNLEMVMQENQKLKAMLESLMQQLGMTAPLPPQQSPPVQPPEQAQQILQPQQLQQASQPALPTVTPKPGNVLPRTTVSQRAMIEQIIEAKMAEQNEGSATYDLWHDMSMKCEQPSAHEDAVKLCQRSLKPEIKEKLLGANILTFEYLNNTVAEIEIFFAENPTTSYGRVKPPKDENTRSREVNAVDFSAALRKAGGKGDTPASSNSKKEERRSAPTLSERFNTPYSFTREHTRELLDICLQENLMTLPEPKCPEGAAMVDKPNYCPYHRVLGHTLENCYLFKNQIEKLIQANIIDMAEHLVNPPKSHQQPKLTFSANVIHVMA
ncbi:hypothetical protein Taro_023449 [Colocasia esculenta]|uniref:Gag-pro-like protein n=1 Tax=Colocasia esculenta TaxID=4460 RepID=A0A843UXF5_COLES|nr:hypothetical protein [Colocasia esculenta]